MSNFKEGDVVELQSGSNELTINSIDREFAEVAWFNYDEKTIQTFTIKLTSLKKVEQNR